MNTTELIEYTNHLSTGKSNLTEKEKNLYLKFLNMANYELYNLASTGLACITKKEEIFLDENSNAFVLPSDLFRISSVVANNSQKLTQGLAGDTNLLEVKKYNILSNHLYTNTEYLDTKPHPKTDAMQKYISLYFVPNPATLALEERAEEGDVAKSITTPVLPKPFHIFLVHGAVYYFYFANKVFLDKMAYIRTLWQEDKEILTKFKNNGW